MPHISTYNCIFKSLLISSCVILEKITIGILHILWLIMNSLTSALLCFCSSHQVLSYNYHKGAIHIYLIMHPHTSIFFLIISSCVVLEWITSSVPHVLNIYLTNFGQNVVFWTFCDHDKGIIWSWQVAKILKIKIIILFYFGQKHEKSKKKQKKWVDLSSLPSQSAEIMHLFLDFGLSIISWMYVTKINLIST